jgi:hypothetical protein
MDDGTPLVPLSDSLFWINDQMSFRIEMGPDGRPRMLHSLRASGDVVPYEPVAEAAPTPAQLAEYAGEYTSEEAEVTYRVAEEDGKLVVHARPATSYPLTPLYADAFDASGVLVRFRRDAAGKVSELSLGTPRVWDLRLARVR